MSQAFELIQAQLASGKTRQKISEEIGYSRTAVSLYAAGKYCDGLEAIEAAIVRAYVRRECPFLGEEVAESVCQSKALSPRPFGGQTRVAWWSACQVCVFKPEIKGGVK